MSLRGVLLLNLRLRSVSVCVLNSINRSMDAWFRLSFAKCKKMVSSITMILQFLQFDTARIASSIGTSALDPSAMCHSISAFDVPYFFCPVLARILFLSVHFRAPCWQHVQSRKAFFASAMFWDLISMLALVVRLVYAEFIILCYTQDSP